MKKSMKAHKDQEWSKYCEDVRKKQEIGENYKNTISQRQESIHR